MQEAEARGAKPQKQNSSLPEHIQQAASTERGMKLQHRDGAVQRKNAEKGGKGKGKILIVLGSWVSEGDGWARSILGFAGLVQPVLRCWKCDAPSAADNKRMGWVSWRRCGRRCSVVVRLL